MKHTRLNGITIAAIFLLTIFLLSTDAIAQNPEWINYTVELENHDAIQMTEVNGKVWVSCYNYLIEFDGSNMVTYDDSLWGGSNSGINCLETDPNGNLWMGTTNHGLVYFNGVEWTVYDTSNSELPHNSVTSIAIDENGTKWIGTILSEGESTLTSFDGVGWTVYDSTNSGFPGGYVGSIAISSNGTVWFGIWLWDDTRGLFSFNDTIWTSYDTTNSEFPPGGVISIHLDGNDEVWVYHVLIYPSPMSPGEISLVHFDGLNWTIYNESNSGLFEDGNAAFAVEQSGKVWFGYQDTGPELGILSFDGTEWVTYTPSNSPLPNTYISSIAIDQHNNKWVAHANGISVFNEAGVTVGIDDTDEIRMLPSNINLTQNYPNPFNPSTTISYSLPEAGEVDLLIYDLQGRLVDKLFSGPQSSGTHDIQWSGSDQNGNQISTGVYLCKMLAGDYSQTIKMVYLK